MKERPSKSWQHVVKVEISRKSSHAAKNLLKNTYRSRNAAEILRPEPSPTARGSFYGHSEAIPFFAMDLVDRFSTSS
jgi:hypothetical protein